MSKYILVKQNELFDCGAACLEMILEYYDGYIGLDRLSYMLNVSSKGINAYDIVTFARKLGFESYGDNVIKNYPCIVLVKKNHFYHYVVIYKKIKDKYLIADPDIGMYRMNINKFNDIWEHIVLNFKPLTKLPKINKTKLIDFIKKTIKNNMSLYLLIITSSFIVLVVSIIYSLFYKVIINNSSLNVLIAFILLILIKLTFLFINNLSNIKSDKNISKSLSTDIFNKLINLPYMYFKNHTTGEIINRFNDCFKVKELINNLVIIVSLELPLLLISLIIIFVINENIFLLVLLVSIIYLLFNLIINKKYVVLLNKLYNFKDQSITLLTDSLMCYESIKGCNKEQYIINRLNEKYNDYIDSYENYNKLLNIKNTISEFILGIGGTLIIYFGIKNMDIANFLIINSFYTYVVDILKDIIDVLVSIKDSNLSYKRIYELDIKDNYGTINTIDNYDISYKNVNFKYGNNIVLNNYNLNIKSGEKVLIYGSSGKGKSTLLKLIKRYYQTNNLYIGSNNINNYTKEALNKIIYIGQNETLFSDTLKNNLMCDDVVDKYVNQCFVNEITNDLNMLILDQGFNLSGGEKERIILLRSILNKFEILIIDESLSQVDSKLERNILINLFKEFKDKTIIFISHRLDNKDLFKRIINIDC